MQIQKLSYFIFLIIYHTLTRYFTLYFILLQLFSYPYTPVPISLCHLDGIANKPQKSALAKLLERPVDSQGEPSATSILLVDGEFLFHQLHAVPLKFGDISLQILHRITATEANKVYLLFDEYWKPSIKDNEHITRNNCYQDFCIRGVV